MDAGSPFQKAICRPFGERIRKSVSQKFNETKKWNCSTFEDLYDKIEDRKEANDIVNSIKICDPAVGSGHFLVSALNEKIVWAETSLGNQFCLVEGGVYLNKTSFMIPSDDLALLAILNSKLVRFYLKSIVSKVRGGYFSMSKAYVETVPIVYAKDIFNFIEKVKKIIELKKQNPTTKTTDVENQINQLVYHLHDLTYEEIKIVEGV